MIGYVTLGTNEFERAAAFYDALLSGLGAKRLFTTERSIHWGKRPGVGMLAVYKPYDGQPATAGNGVMVAIGVRGREQVEAMHARALGLGASDEGAPGSRGEGFYGAYFRDLDGNKLCVFTHEQAAGQ
ncbi:MAG: VOC family protein [Myxococcales bacterium]|nr:VOC family protein [Myxococcales bacterium]MDD9964722.1 VOC family protein [Myxococcales bacterium]